MAMGPLALFFGTRPQVIKASVLRQALGGKGSVVAVDTALVWHRYRLQSTNAGAKVLCCREPQGRASADSRRPMPMRLQSRRTGRQGSG